MHSPVDSRSCIVQRITLFLVLVTFGCTALPLHAEVYLYRNGVGSGFPPRTLDEKNRTGWQPNGELVQAADGTFYGVAFKGGANGNGTVFSYRSGVTDGQGSSILALYSFSALQDDSSHRQTNNDGANPYGGLVLASDGALYGTAQSGGTGATGTIFRITTSGTLTTLYSFSALDASNHNADGANSWGKLVEAPDGSLLGTTRGGGDGGGVVFRVTPAGVFNVLYKFAAPDANLVNASGAFPAAGLLIANDGNYYGVTTTGGPGGRGVVFKLTPQGAFSVLHTFSTWEAGATPSSALMQATDGSLYGTTSQGGAGYGTIFRITLSGDFETLYAFKQGPVVTNNTDGADPIGPLIEGADGTLYGATREGSMPGAAGGGSIYELSPSRVYSQAHLFATGDGDAAGPAGGLIMGNDGKFYGVAQGKAAAGYEFSGAGSLYSLSPSPSNLMTLTLAPQTIRVNETYTVSWAAPTGDMCFAPRGASFPPTGSYPSGSSQYGDIAAAMACRTPLGIATRTAVEHILPALPTLTMSASPTSITLGTSTTLSWTASAVSGCAGSGAWSGPQGDVGPRTVTPTATGVSTYTLTCEGPGGVATASVDVTVGAAVNPTITMNVTPSTIAAGAAGAVLNWSTTGAQSCTASGAWSGSQALTGSISVSNAQAGTYTYSLNCTGPGGSATASASLQVTSASSSGGSNGGGGAMSLLSLLALAGFVVARLAREVLANESETRTRAPCPRQRLQR